MVKAEVAEYKKHWRERAAQPRPAKATWPQKGVGLACLSV